MNYTTSLSKFTIVNKDGQSVSFEVNAFQRKFLDAMTGKDIILKARQIGYSSLILGLFTLDFLLKENSRSVCISHDAPSAQRLLDRVKYFLKSAEEKGLQLDLKYNSRSELVNASKNSTFYIGAAGSKSFGRGDTLTNLHLSEFSFYPDCEKLLASVLQAVVPGGRTIIESTANGSNYFKTFWDKTKRGETGFTGHFFGNDFYSQAFLDQKKQELGEDLYHQEYPLTDSEAFILSGDCFFDKIKLSQYLDQVKPTIDLGRTFSYPVHWFREPLNQEQFILAADPAEGGDSCALVLLSKERADIVAEAAFRAESTILGSLCNDLGRFVQEKTGFYPTIGIEKNTGTAALYVLRESNYPMIYQMPGNLVSVEDKRASNYGWSTNAATRPKMLDDLALAIREQSIHIFSKSCIDQLFSFIRHPKTGRPEAASGGHDDLVMSLAIAWQLYQLVPRQFPRNLYVQQAINQEKKKKWAIGA
jgi:hypothetical protein